MPWISEKEKKKIINEEENFSDLIFKKNKITVDFNYESVKKSFLGKKIPSFKFEKMDTNNEENEENQIEQSYQNSKDFIIDLNNNNEILLSLSDLKTVEIILFLFLLNLLFL